MALQPIGVQATVQDADQYFRTIDQMNKATADFAQGAQKGGGIFSEGFGQVVTGALRQVGAIAVNALADAAKAVAGFVGDSVKVAGDFEQGMNKFAVVAGKGVDTKGLQQFRDLFIQLGRELPVSTSEVEDAATEMVSGGIDPAIVAGGALRQTLNFAAASGLSLSDAAATSAKFLAGWTDAAATTQQKVDFLALSTDTLTKAAAASSTTAAELRLGLFNVQGSAQALHVPFEDATTALAELAPAFESSAQAGTALNVFLTRLVPQTKPALSVMQDLGIVLKNGQNIFFDSKGQFLGLSNAAEVLKTKLAGLTDEQKISTLHTLFGNDAMKVGNLLSQTGADGYAAMAAKMREANGVSEAAATMQQGYNVALENAKGSVEALQITIGSALLPVLTDLMNNVVAPAVNTLSTFASAVFGDDDAFNQLSPTLQGMVTTIDLLVADVQELVGAFQNGGAGTTEFAARIGDLASDLGLPGAAIQSIVLGIDDLIASSDTLLPIIEGIGAALGSFAILTTVTGWVSGLSAAVTAAGVAFAEAGGGIEAVVAILGGPVTLAIAAVAAAIGVLYVAWTNDWGGIQEIAASAWAAIQPSLAEAEQWLGTEIPIALQKLSDVWTNTLQPALVVVGDYLQSTVFPILESLAGTYLKGTEAEVSALAKVWSDVLWPAIKIVADFVSGTLIPLIAALVNVNIAAWQLALKALTGLWEKELQPALMAAGDYLSKTLGPAFTSLGNWLSATFGPLLKNVTTWLGDVTGGFTGIGNAVNDVIKRINDFANATRNLKLPDWLTPGSPTPWEIALRGIADAVGSEVNPALNDFSGQLGTFDTAAGGAANTLTTTFGKALANVGKGIAGAGTQAIGGAKSLATTLTNFMSANPLSDQSEGWGKGLVDGLVQGINGAAKSANKAAAKLMDGVADSGKDASKMHSPSQVTDEMGQDWVMGLIQGMGKMAPALNSLVTTVFNTLQANAGSKFTAMRDDIQKQVEDFTKQVGDIQSAIGSFAVTGLTSDASIDRQKAANIAAMDDLSAHAKTIVQQQLADAEKVSAAINDPKQQAAYFAARSKAILEMAKLQTTIDNQISDQERENLTATVTALQNAIATTTNDVEKQSDQILLDKLQTRLNTPQLMPSQEAALDQQIALINAAQQNEAQALLAQQAQGSDTTDLIKQIQDFMTAVQNVKNGPTAFDPTIQAFMNTLDQLRQVPATPAQMAAGSGSTSTAYNNNSYNLGIYSSQSPAVVQQSFAMLQAATP